MPLLLIENQVPILESKEKPEMVVSAALLKNTKTSLNARERVKTRKRRQLGIIINIKPKPNGLERRKGRDGRQRGITKNSKISLDTIERRKARYRLYVIIPLTIIPSDLKVFCDGSQGGKNVAQVSKAGISDAENAQMPLHHLQRPKIRERSNRSTDEETPRNSRNGRHIARYIGIGCDVEASACIMGSLGLQRGGTCDEKKPPSSSSTR